MNWYSIGEWWVRKFPLKEKDYASAGVPADVVARLCPSCQPIIKAMLERNVVKETTYGIAFAVGLVLLFAGIVVGSYL